MSATEDNLNTLGSLEADDLSETSDYAESCTSSTTSLTDSINEHVYANGRRYHRKSEGKYALPSDETEMNRLDLYHHLQLLTLGGALHRSPIKNDPHNVLDCGTGTGIWALDFGDIHKGSHVIGVDMVPIQPTWTFPNVSFEVDDLENTWTWHKKFDFIHSRHVATSIRDWEKYVKQMYEFCIPGGWVELSEHGLDTLHCDDGTSDPDTSPLLKYMASLRAGLEQAGVDPYRQGEDYKKLLEEAGFVDVKVDTYKIPWGTWPKNATAKHIGGLLGEVATTGIEAHGLALMTSVLKMTPEEAKDICQSAVEKVRTRKEHCYHLQWQIYGRKPEDAN